MSFLQCIIFTQPGHAPGLQAFARGAAVAEVQTSGAVELGAVKASTCDTLRLQRDVSDDGGMGWENGGEKWWEADETLAAMSCLSTPKHQLRSYTKLHKAQSYTKLHTQIAGVA